VNLPGIINRIVMPFSLACCFASARAEDFQGSMQELPYDQEFLFYSKASPDNPVSRLQKKIDSGEVKLKWDEKFGWLPALLDALHVPKSSQMLVFSKTSLQRRLIAPRTPRSLFFNDDVYLGFIPDAPVMEVSVADPKLGGVFYKLEQEEVRRPQFQRDSDCLSCHGGPKTLGVPGHFLRSVSADSTGELASSFDGIVVTHCTPMAERWGGWYVTGSHGSQTHRGNLVGEKAVEQTEDNPNAFGNLTDLSRFFDTSKYLAHGSDIVALMVLEHQAHMHNYITRLNYETQQMVGMYQHIRYLKHQEDAFLRYLLFIEESPLSEPVSGDPQFVKDFAALGPRDSKGRSLRDFDLQTRLFKYPCSYLIYSDAFDKLPPVMRDELLQRLYDILTGKDDDKQFAMREEDRKAVLEILRDTKANLPAYWKKDAPVASSQ
jgi:hypothetical protein